MLKERPRGYPSRDQSRSAFGVDRTRQICVGFLICGLHVMGMEVWWNMNTEMRSIRLPATQSLVTLFLPEPVSPSIVRTTPKNRSVASTMQSSQHRNPNPNPNEPTEPMIGSMPTVAAPESTTPTPLNLTLPRGELAAILAPKIPGKSQLPQRLPKTVETIIADAFGESGPWTEERIDFDHIRLRRGNTCIMLERPAAARLFPMDEAANRVPWKANTYRCG